MQLPQLQASYHHRYLLKVPAVLRKPLLSKNRNTSAADSAELTPLILRARFSAEALAGFLGPVRNMQLASLQDIRGEQVPAPAIASKPGHQATFIELYASEFLDDVQVLSLVSVPFDFC